MELSHDIIRVIFDKTDTHTLVSNLQTSQKIYNIITQNRDLSLRVYTYYFGQEDAVEASEGLSKDETVFEKMLQKFS